MIWDRDKLKFKRQKNKVLSVEEDIELLKDFDKIMLSEVNKMDKNDKLFL